MADMPLRTPETTMEGWEYVSGVGWHIRVHEPVSGSFCGYMTLRRVAAGVLARARTPAAISAYLHKIRLGAD